MDTLSPQFAEFTGEFHDGTGTFLRTTAARDGSPLLSRITFSDIKPRSLRWELAVSRDDGQQWRQLWVMVMTRAGD